MIAGRFVHEHVIDDDAILCRRSTTISAKSLCESVVFNGLLDRRKRLLR